MHAEEHQKTCTQMFIVYSKTLHNIQKLETAQMSINNSLDKLTMASSYNGVLYQNENKQITAMHNNIKLGKRGQT